MLSSVVIVGLQTPALRVILVPLRESHKTRLPARLFCLCEVLVLVIKRVAHSAA
jgi:hypothetical protein